MRRHQPMMDERDSVRRVTTRKELALIVFLLFIMLLNTGCKKTEETVEERIMNVKVWTVENKILRPFVSTIGTLKPFEEVIVSSELEGIVKNVRVDEGSFVSKGMLLAEINETDYRLEALRAEASMRQTEATLTNTKLEYERKASLYKEELVTRQQFDDISARLTLSERELDRAKASLSLARERRSKTKIYSPMQGFVREKKVTTGDYVRNGSVLMVVIQSNPIKLNFTVPEKDVGKLKIGQDVLFKVDSFPDQEFKGRVRIIYPSLEERTRTLQVEALVPNSDNRLKPGLFAKVTLFTEQARDMIVIPITAILYDNAKVKVFVAEGNVARERVVNIGNKYGEMLEIVEGLKKGETLVVVGQNNLSDGVKIHVAR